MNLKQLEFFLDVVEHGGFSRAASVRNVDQPFVSRQIRKLEEEMGAPLLYRNGRGVELTEAGHELINVAKPLLSEMQQLRERLQFRATQPRGRISVGIIHHLGEALLPNLLKQFHDSFPLVQIHISGGNSSIIQEWLLRGRIDVGIFYDIGHAPQLAAETLLDERVVLVGTMALAQKHRIAGERTIRLVEGAKLPLVLPGPQHGVRIRLDRLAQEEGIILQSPFEIDLHSSLKALVMSGQGFGLMPVGAIIDKFGDKDLFIADVVEPELTSSPKMAFASNKAASPIAREFANALRQMARQFDEMLNEIMSNRR